MPDTIRVKSNLPVALRIAEPHPDPEHVGNSPVLKQAVLKPGINEGIDAAMFRAWSDANPTFVASKDDVRGGTVDGKVYVMTEDEPEGEFGFEIALERATQGENAKAADEGSVLKDKVVTAEDQRPGSAAPVAPAPVLAGAGGAPVKVPANDGNLAQGKPADVKK